MKTQHYLKVAPEVFAEAPGASLRWIIGEREGATHFALRVGELQEGASTPFHSHDFEHEIFVLSGLGKVFGGSQEAAVAEGDAVFIPPMEEHRLVNRGHDPFRFICCIPLPGDK
jgi:quercetin dioxygenase-like cupin family protein